MAKQYLPTGWKMSSSEKNYCSMQIYCPLCLRFDLIQLELVLTLPDFFGLFQLTMAERCLPPGWKMSSSEKNYCSVQIYCPLCSHVNLLKQTLTSQRSFSLLNTLKAEQYLPTGWKMPSLQVLFEI